MSNANIRGLPDERPRPSVANLIGRFEQRASKRQSTAGASPTASPSASRSTSVVSHNTGDLALIEAKERREWPPQQVQSKTSSSATSPGTTESNAVNFDDLRRSLSQPSLAKLERNVLASPSLDVPNDLSPPSLSASSESIAKDAPEPVANSDPPTDSVPVTEAEKLDMSKKAQTSTARALGKLTASKSNPASTNSALRTAARGTTPRSSAAVQSKSTPSTPNKTTTPVTKSLTAQCTGASTASAGASAASRLGAKSPPVSTPRAKTPNAVRASTSGSASKASTARTKTPTASSISAARPKTPSATTAGTVRPKTPSGLYAPTKASLARARNVEAPPAPVHRPSVPLSALERLTKPTAASASKVRSPVASPPRAAPAKTTRGAAPTRGATLKPRVGLAPARMKAEREKKEKEEAARTAKAAAAISTSGDEAPERPTTSEHAPSEDECIEQPSFASSEAPEHESHSLSELESEHSEVPSDIESYDDAFASDDDDRELDSAHIQSALPREEGELAPFAMTPDAEPSVGFALDVPEVKDAEHVEGEGVTGETKDEAEAPVPESEDKEGSAADAETSLQPEEDVELEVKLETIANGAATPKPMAAVHNGVSVADDEFDSVLDMLQVKPVRAASPSNVVTAGEIPDEE